MSPELRSHPNLEKTWALLWSQLDSSNEASQKCRIYSAATHHLLWHVGHDDVLTQDLAVAVEDEGIRCALVAAGWTRPDKEDIGWPTATAFLDVLNGRRQILRIFQRLEEASETLLHSVQALVLGLASRKTFDLIVDRDHGVFHVVLEDLVHALLAKSLKMIRPSRMHWPCGAGLFSCHLRVLLLIL